jgi:hypothetical protein
VEALEERSVPTTTVGSGQQLVVNAGETVTGVTVLPGGYLLVLSGGTDIGTMKRAATRPSGPAA